MREKGIRGGEFQGFVGVSRTSVAKRFLGSVLGNTFLLGVNWLNNEKEWGRGEVLVQGEGSRGPTSKNRAGGGRCNREIGNSFNLIDA